MLPLNEVNEENIYFLDSKKNILMDGTFTKLMFMNEWFTMNGIYIAFPIFVQSIEINPNMGQKHTITFSVNAHLDLIEKIEALERAILSRYGSYENNKVPSYNINYSLRMGIFKIYKTIHKNTGFALKISGIWENAKNYGLSYKIVEAI
jgi:hypothetical protein